MNRTTARRTAPALVALALALVVGGCSGDAEPETSAPAASPSANAALCDGFGELETSVDDLKAEPLDLNGTPEEVQAAAAELGIKAAEIKTKLLQLSALSDGPVAAAIGEMNQKADALRESLILAAAESKEELGPKITAAQEELDTAFADVTAKVDSVCGAS